MNAADEVEIHQLRGKMAGGAKTVSQPTLVRMESLSQ
jgi:hypothetical protein